MSLEQCSNFAINDGTFTAVAGHVYNIQGNLVMQQPHPVHGASNVLSQYQEVKAGQVCLKRKIATSRVRGWVTGGWRRLDAHRTIHVATIGDREREFLHVSYSGPDAFQVYQKDIKTFATVKDINHTQLFGYSNWKALPSLVFYDALVPVSHIFERNRFSSLLYSYFNYASLAQGIDARTLLAELWINPMTGTLCKGPYVEDSSDTLYDIWWGESLTIPDSDHPSLDLQTYNNTGLLFQYLIRILSVRKIIEGIRWSHGLIPEWPNNQDAKLILSFLPGTIYSRTSRRIIARYPADRKRWYHFPWKEAFHIPDTMRENMTVMKDRSVRFMFNLADIASLQSFELNYDLRARGMWGSFADSWVAQTHWIFSQLGIEEGEWGEYSILHHFYVKFKRRRNKGTSCKQAEILTSQPIYLFIRRVPRPSEDENGWDAWLGGRKYYWSYDSAGKEEMSEDEQQRLGLPSFRTSIQVWHGWWDHDAHDAIKMVNCHEGFEPTSMDLARSVECTILELVGGNTRFEEVEDGDNENSAIGISVEPAQPLPSEFDERIRWIRAHHSLFSGHTGTLSSKDSPCLDGPDIADVD